MDQATHDKIVSFIRVYRRRCALRPVQSRQVSGVIPSMCVIRRMDAVLGPTKQAVLNCGD